MSETSSGTGKAGRYQRSTGGLVGAMIVTVAVIVAFVAFRSLFREQTEVKPEPVDYLAVVSYAQEQGLRPVHPRRLPEGWMATSVSSTPAEGVPWYLGMLTDEGDFVGVRQEEESVQALLEEHVDEEASEGGTVTTDGSVADEWTAYSDEGGDHAYAAEVGSESVLVYGSAPEKEIRALLDLLAR